MEKKELLTKLFFMNILEGVQYAWVTGKLALFPTSPGNFLTWPKTELSPQILLRNILKNSKLCQKPGTSGPSLSVLEYERKNSKVLCY